MKRFDNTISKLKSDPAFQIKVVQLPENKVLANNMNAQQMSEQFGGVEQYFEALHKRGITALKIFDRRKNGSGFMSIGEPYTLNMVSKEENAPVVEKQLPATQSQAIPAVPIPPGLSGGMNGTDFYRAMDYPKLETRCGLLEVENAGYKQKIAELERKILENEFSTAKANATTEMVSTFAPLLAPLLEKLIPSAAPAAPAIGLTGSEQLSDTKRQVINIIMAASEDTAYYIGLVAKQMHNEAFQSELFALLDRFTITKQAM